MKNDNLLYLLIVVVVVVGLAYLFLSRTNLLPNLGELSMNAQDKVVGPPDGSSGESNGDNRWVTSGDTLHTRNNATNVGQTVGDMYNPSMCLPQDQLRPEELLPADNSSQWAKCVGRDGEGVLQGQNFLEADRFIGINAVGQTLRNANLQLRSEPPNPQVVVSPWLNTTIAPDVSRRYFEIGQC